MNQPFLPERESKEEYDVFALLRQKTLSQDEKKLLRQSIVQGMHTSHHSHYASFKTFAPMNIFSFLTHRSFVLSALSVVLVLGSGFGIARASEKALPGQTLYPMKINVNEPLIAKFKFSLASRIEWEKERVGRRIIEAETLAEQGVLGEVEKMQIEQELYEHKRTLEEIEGHEIDDDDFFPEEIKSEMKNVNVRVEYNIKDTFIHIEERFETAEDEENEELHGYQDEDEDTKHIFVDVYTEQGVKAKESERSEEERKQDKKTEERIVELKKKREKSSDKEENEIKENKHEEEKKIDEKKDEEQSSDDEESKETEEENASDDEEKE